MSNLTAVPNTDLSDYLSHLFSGGEGYVYVATKNADQEFGQEFFKWPHEEANLSQFIRVNTVKADVYVAPALFSSASATKENVKVSNVVWAEFDGVVPSVESLGALGAVEPTMRIMSSSEGHEHWYWRVSEPITNIQELESINRGLTYRLGADVSGWDANQILRPPGTKNYKRDAVTVLVNVSANGGYPNITFGQVASQAPKITEEMDNSVIPDVADVILKYAWNEQAIKLYRSKPDIGERSSALMQMGYFCAEMAMTDAEIFSVVRNADDRWGKFKNRTDRNRRLTDLIARVRVKHPAELLSINDIETFGFQDFLNSDIQVEWLIEGLLQKEGYMLLTGPSGVGKTQVSLRVGIALALGRPFLGLEITEPCKVLVVSLEMGHADLKYFLNLMRGTLSEEEATLLQTNLILVPRGEPLYLDSPADRMVLESIIAEVKPDVVMIDSAGSTTAGELSSEGSVKLIMDYNDMLRHKYHVATWWIHHMRKAQADNKKPNKMSDVYGNQYLVNRATSVYCLWPKRDGVIEVIPLKKRLAPLEDPWSIDRISNLDFKLSAKDTPGTKENKEKEVTVEFKADEEPDDVPIIKHNGMSGI